MKGKKINMNPPKGFFTKKGRPTMNSVECYIIYLRMGGNPMKDKRVPKETIKAIRKHFGLTEGFECMLAWGLQAGCGTSKTSSGRYYAMNQALRMAESLHPRIAA